MKDHTFTPPWTTEYTETILGNGSLNGWYEENDNAVHIVLEIGSQTRIGVGDWAFGIPNEFGNLVSIGFATADDFGTARYLGYSLFDPMHRLAHAVFPSLSQHQFSHYPVDRDKPFPWAHGDKLRISLAKIE